MHKGEVIIAALHHIHNNPAVWDKPETFDPDRWDTERVKKRGKGDYIPYVPCLYESSLGVTLLIPSIDLPLASACALGSILHSRKSRFSWHTWSGDTNGSKVSKNVELEDNQLTLLRRRRCGH
jgi:hypothetical protein